MPEKKALKSGAPRLEEMSVYPRKDGTSNRKGRELLTEDQAGTQAHSHIKRNFFYWMFREEFLPCLLYLEL